MFMRLIDLEDEILKKRLFMYQHEGGLSAKQAIRLFTNQPTVEAIPVEWIKTYIYSFHNYKFQEEREILIKMLKDWRKENETD